MREDIHVEVNLNGCGLRLLKITVCGSKSCFQVLLKHPLHDRVAKSLTDRHKDKALALWDCLPGPARGGDAARRSAIARDRYRCKRSDPEGIVLRIYLVDPVDEPSLTVGKDMAVGWFIPVHNGWDGTFSH